MVQALTKIYIQSPLPTSSLYVFTLLWKDVEMDEALHSYLHFISFLVSVLFGTPFLHLFSFSIIFLSCIHILNNKVLHRVTQAKSLSHVPTAAVTHNCSEEPSNRLRTLTVECDKPHVCLSCNTDVNIDPASSQVFQKFNLYLKALKIQQLLQWETAAVFKYPGLFLTLVGFVWRHVIIAEIHRPMNIVSLSSLFSNFHTCKPPHIGTCTQDAQTHLMKTKLSSIRWGTHRRQCVTFSRIFIDLWILSTYSGHALLILALPRIRTDTRRSDSPHEDKAA